MHIAFRQRAAREAEVHRREKVVDGLAEVVVRVGGEDPQPRVLADPHGRVGLEEIQGGIAGDLEQRDGDTLL